jgi:DNA-binding NtrC family response regulator
MKETILVADDELGIREFLYELFKDEYNVLLAENGNIAIRLVETEMPDVVLIDMRMPGLSGIEVLKILKEENYKIIPIVITADRDIDHAVEAMKLGAYDYVVKPVDYKKLRITVRNAIDKKNLEEKVDILEKEIKGSFSFPNIIGGKSKGMKTVFSRVENVLNNDATVLIYGESGTGKELIARAIHYNGNRANEPFVAVDCASIPQSLIETELFGYEKGAFTGANKTTKGKFELADEGTLFLDEISNVAMGVQAKLLRVIQEKEFLRIGGNKKISVNVRIISATNQDLKKLIDKGEFREDLYYRLNVIPIDLPPLREREEEVPELIEHFLDKFNRQYNKNIRLTAETSKYLIDYKWPGNVREMENLFNRLVLIADSDTINASDLPGEIYKLHKASGGENIFASEPSLETIERMYIENMLKKYSSNISLISQKLGITRKTLYSKMEKYGVKKD